jgi:hypothetical protein
MGLNILTGIISGIVVTIIVLLTRQAFYQIRDALPAGALFEYIKGDSRDCLIFIARMKDIEQKGEYLTPQPQCSPIGSFQIVLEKRQLTPWVNSVPTTECVSMVLNVLGRVGRTQNINITYADKDYSRWDTPMFIIGGNWKFRRALETCNPYYKYRQADQECGFDLIPTGERFKSDHPMEQDMGLLQKMINPSNDLPVWVVMGIRGAGTAAAAYSLVRWWRELGWLYGKESLCRRTLHPFAWHTLKKVMQG